MSFSINGLHKREGASPAAPAAGRRRLIRWGVIFGVWLVVALLFSSQGIFYFRLRGEAIAWGDVFLRLCGILTWAAMTPFIFWVSHRWPIARKGWPRTLLAHGLAILVVLPVDIGSFLLMNEFLFHAIVWNGNPPLWEKFVRLTAESFGFSIYYYLGVVGICHALDYYDGMRERELSASQLEARLSEARLQLLRTQLQPHFLFNTLHTISALLHEDARAADRMISRLSDLLRLTLDKSEEQEVTLREELEFLDPYVAIERTRFNDRLTVIEDIAPEALDARVPSMLLQPLVENAVRHGIGARSGAGRIEIRARRDNGRLALEVRDDGNGLPNGRQGVQTGVGLGNTRARLRQLYGEDHRFELADAPGGGLKVTIEIPFREPVPTSEGG
ncbi:MAG TPA: histidine kinase [Gemmatimonadota bacterium]|jgi:signal transduction histidine kinase